MATTYTVTTTFAINTTAVASQVNQNFTDVLTALNSLDAGNLGSGTVPLARISGLTSSQCASAFFKDEDDMASDSATAVSSQQAIKAHVTASSTDGYSPTTYASGETTTLPNGLIMKFGLASGSSALSVSFGTAFPTAIKTVVVTPASSNAYDETVVLSTVATTGFTMKWANARYSSVYWMAIGY